MKIDLIFKEFPIFYKWTVKKQLNETHLSILTEFKDSNQLKNLISWIENHNVSHSQGVQILDLAGELLLMGKNITPLLEKHRESDTLIKELKKLRFPESSLREERKKKLLNKLNLAESIEAKWIREKDRTGIQIQFKSFSAKDLKQKIEKLNRFYNEKTLWED